MREVFMKKILVILGFGVCLVLGLTARAYESDTHLRISYVLARSVGIGDEVAKYLSIGNQYIDVSIVTSAMLLSSQRQLYHFHGDAAKISTTGHGSVGLLGRIFKSKLSLAERNHALASIQIYHGLIEGDLQKLAAAIHQKMDSFGHAGYSNFLGHAPDGHSPDRAFLEPKKYEDMIREVLASYVALKSVLPVEFIDEKSALNYLNQFAENTHLQRKLNSEDLKDASRIAVVVLANKELQSIFRENMYRKYEYKLLALERIYVSFKGQGKINADVTFNDLFPEEFVRNPSFDTTEVITQALMKNAHSEFLKTLEGKDVFDLVKLLEGQSEESFMRRYRMEVKRYEDRLRELDYLELIKNNETALEKQSRVERLEQEKLRLLSGLGDSANEELMSEEFIKIRAKELAQLKLAGEMANHLTKDFIPRDKNEYIKHQFEGEYANRSFEKYYKDEVYRRFIHKNFGVNWVYSKSSIVSKFMDAAKKFKNILALKPMSAEKIEEWKELSIKAANELIPDSELSERDKAQIIEFNAKNKALWVVKQLKYVLQAAPIFYGYRYMNKLSAEAKKYAHDHMTEDMKKAIEEGKYKANIIEKTTAAYKNVMQIKRGTIFRCSHLFKLLAD